MWFIDSRDPLAVSVTRAIRTGDLARLKQLLEQEPRLATARIEETNPKCAGGRTLLHIATDSPGHFPNVAETIAELIAHGADVNASFEGFHSESPLHWAASTDDLIALNALLERGADIEARGGVIDGGTAIADAVAFGRWKCARRLYECGARVTLWQAAALGLADRVEAFLAATPRPTSSDITNAFWCACHGAQQGTAELLLAHGVDINWDGYNHKRPLDAAMQSNAEGSKGELIAWLRSQGARQFGSANA